MCRYGVLLTPICACVYFAVDVFELAFYEVAVPVLFVFVVAHIVLELKGRGALLRRTAPPIPRDGIEPAKRVGCNVAERLVIFWQGGAPAMICFGTITVNIHFVVPFYQGSTDAGKLATVLLLVPAINELCLSFLRLGRGADGACY